jgi:hypothetical protein
MRSTFKVLFYVNGSKEKNGIVPVMGRVTINGSVAQFSCKQTIAKDLWDAKGNRAKGSYQVRVRSRNHLAVFIRKCYRRSDISMLELTPDFIKEYEIYLSTDAGLHNASVWSNCMWLKTIVAKVHYNGLTPRNPFAVLRGYKGTDHR